MYLVASKWSFLGWKKQEAPVFKHKLVCVWYIPHTGRAIKTKGELFFPSIAGSGRPGVPGLGTSSPRALPTLRCRAHRCLPGNSFAACAWYPAREAVWAGKVRRAGQGARRLLANPLLPPSECHTGMAEVSDTASPNTEDLTSPEATLRLLSVDYRCSGTQRRARAA